MANPDFDAIDQFLHDADRKAGGSWMAQIMGDHRSANEMTREAVALYQQALDADPERISPAWKEFGNQDDEFLVAHKLDAVIAARRGDR